MFENTLVRVSSPYCLYACEPRTWEGTRAHLSANSNFILSFPLRSITHSHPPDPFSQTLNFSFRHSHTTIFDLTYERGLQFWNSVAVVLPHKFQGRFFFFFFFRFLLSNLNLLIRPLCFRSRERSEESLTLSTTLVNESR